MNRFIATLVCCCGLYWAVAQDMQRSVLSLDLKTKAELSEPQPIPFKATPFLSYSITQAWQEGINYAAFEIRFSTNGKTWTDWERLTQDGHNPPEEARWVSRLMQTDAAHRFFQYRWLSEVPAQDLELHFFSPGVSPTSGASSTGSIAPRSSCGCEQPNFEGRSDWCSNCPSGSSPASHNVSHLIIHHSAGTNEASDWAAIVRSIWDFHVNGRGWDDIGYNWLIDPNGVLYAGRASDIRGAHFCGTNTGTEGVCVLGDFTEVEPTTSVRNALAALWAWKACERDVIPDERTFHSTSGKNLFTISGHRDGCATACPGDAFYPLLGDVRQNVVDYQRDSCSNVVSVDEAFELQVRAFPNPVQSHFTIQWTDAFGVSIQGRIHSIRGEVVQHFQVQQQQHIELDVAELPAGIYIVHLEDTNQMKTSFKLLKFVE